MLQAGPAWLVHRHALLGDGKQEAQAVNDKLSDAAQGPESERSTVPRRP